MTFAGREAHLKEKIIGIFTVLEVCSFEQGANARGRVVVYLKGEFGGHFHFFH